MSCLCLESVSNESLHLEKIKNSLAQPSDSSTCELCQPPELHGVPLSPYVSKQTHTPKNTPCPFPNVRP